MAHALLSATIAAAKGDNAVAGAAGAGSAPLIAATLAQNLYGSDAANLSESQKDTVAALTTLAGSLAGGLAGGNTASALAGGQAGGQGAKNEVENNSLNTRAAATLMQTLRACAGRCDVAQLSQGIQQQEQYWDKVVAERCGGGGASLAVCASTLNGLQESLSFISSALGMAKTPQERALLLATYNEQVRDINTATAQFEKLGASASVIDVFMTQTALILPDLVLSVGGKGRPALAVKPVAGQQTVGAESAPAAVGQLQGGVLGQNKVPSVEVDVPKTGIVDSPAVNNATYQPLKNQLYEENLQKIAAYDARLAIAVNGGGGSKNFSIGTGSTVDADYLGKVWVGDGAKLVSNQIACPGCLKSADGLRIYRPPSNKPNTPVEFNPTGMQANFVKLSLDGKIISNGHLVVIP